MKPCSCLLVLSYKQTANPLPMLAGAAMMSAGQDDMYEENKNVQSIANESEKRADIEKTGLLDETDDW